MKNEDENEEEKNELFTLSCNKLHFWYRGTLKPPGFKYVIILFIALLYQKLQPLEGRSLESKNPVFYCFFTSIDHLQQAATFVVVQLWKNNYIFGIRRV